LEAVPDPRASIRSRLGQDSIGELFSLTCPSAWGSPPSSPTQLNDSFCPDPQVLPQSLHGPDSHHWSDIPAKGRHHRAASEQPGTL